MATYNEIFGFYGQTYRSGKDEGIEQGIERGKVAGIAEGIERGIEQGKVEGIAEGIEQGIEQGIAVERTNSIKKQITSLKKYEVPHEEIIKTIMSDYDLSRDEVEKYLK